MLIQTSACNGKQQFATKGAALKVTKKLGAVRVYRCPFCHSYHIGGRSDAKDGRVPGRRR